jgi:acid-sensing ion channel, other
MDFFSIEYVTAVAQVCDPELFGDIDPEKRTNCANCTRLLDYMMGNVDEMFSYCERNLYEAYCPDLFKKYMTEEGVCYAFNTLIVYKVDKTMYDYDYNISDQWTLEDGYMKTTDDLYPWTGSKTNVAADIFVYKSMTDFLCKGAFQGFKFYMHLPNEVPQISKHFILLPYNQHVRIFINPKMTVTDPDLRDLPIVKRQCYFSDERYLRFYRYYTQNNCEHECEANVTLKNCGCFVFYMPSEFI